MQTIENYNHKGFNIKIALDETSENPIKEWDMLGKYICFSDRYDLGNCNDFSTPEEVEVFAKKNNCILYPLYIYDHSSIALSLSPFACHWDSGQLGYIMIDKAKVLSEYDKKRFTANFRNKIHGILECEIMTYNQYLSGEVYGYIITDQNGEDIETCWGFYGLEYVKQEAESIIVWQKKENPK